MDTKVGGSNVFAGGVLFLGGGGEEGRVERKTQANKGNDCPQKKESVGKHRTALKKSRRSGNHGTPKKGKVRRDELPSRGECREGEGKEMERKGNRRKPLSLPR